ncbi:cation:dicarboxylate symporter family transporter, partial [Klebsiella variicola]
VILIALGRVNASWSLANRVLLGMVLGILFGLALHLIYADDSATLKQSISWFSIVGGGYIQLLQMIVMPLVLVSVLNSVAKLNSTASLGKI